MKGISIGFAFCLLTFALSAQTVQQKLQKAWQQFEADSQLRHAISSLYVIDAKTGDIVFDKNSQIGLAGASTQKIVTAASAFELLGKDYKYKTQFFVDQERLIVRGSYDPTFGSWRYAATKDTTIFESIVDQLKLSGSKKIKYVIVHVEDLGLVPGGWINEDIANYYGASIHGLNWIENQYELRFIPGSGIGDPTVIDTSVTRNWWEFTNNCKTGSVGSGDNAYIYFLPGTGLRAVTGTIPAGVKNFSIYGADPTPNRSFSLAIQNYLAAKKFFIGSKDQVVMTPPALLTPLWNERPLYTHFSPSLDSMVYWFLKKSINLYGEALVKTFAYQKQGFGSTDSGTIIVRKFWKEKGIDDDELNIYDGSGLSPLNRLTTHAQVEILKYAKTREWFSSFYYALPEYNGMKMKSGTISDVKGFCGYHVSKEGKEYVFSFLVNNYSGRASSLVNKMYKVLDELK